MIAAGVLLGLAGCGGSSKPSYCSDRSKLESSVKDLANVSLSGGVSGVESQLKTIESDANALVDSARSDFPSQTSAIESSVNALASGVKALPSSPSATQVAVIAADATGVVSSVKSFSEATKSECS